MARFGTAELGRLGRACASLVYLERAAVSRDPAPGQFENEDANRSAENSIEFGLVLRHKERVANLRKPQSLKL